MPIRSHSGRVLRLRRRALASAVALGLLMCSGADAHAELRMAGGDSTPATLQFPGPSALVYTVHLTAEGQDERFALQFEAPWFGRDGTGTAPIGASLSFVGQTPRIEGPARLLGPSLAAMGYVACGPTVPVHGFDSERRAWDVLVPAGTTSTLSFDFIPARSSPWPDTDYAVTFEALPRMVDREPATLAAPQRVTVAGPPTAGSRGVHLTLRSTPKTTLVGMQDAARVRIGRRIAIRGAIRPRLRNARITLWTSTRARPSFRRTRTLRTDRRGRFRTTVIARRGMQVMARVAAHGARYRGDYSCPLGFEVSRSG